MPYAPEGTTGVKKIEHKENTTLGRMGLKKYAETFWKRV
jgi:hypothetical protein